MRRTTTTSQDWRVQKKKKTRELCEQKTKEKIFIITLRAAVFSAFRCCYCCSSWLFLVLLLFSVHFLSSTSSSSSQIRLMLVYGIYRRFGRFVLHIVAYLPPCSATTIDHLRSFACTSGDANATLMH